MADLLYDRSLHGIHNLGKPAVIADPLTYIDAVAGLGPLFYDEVGRVWVCTGYAESVKVLSDYRSFSSARTHEPDALLQRGLDPVADLGDMLARQVLFADPPRHDDLRSAQKEQFSQHRVRERDAMMRSLVDEVLAGLPRHGRIDLVADFAEKLPAALVGSLLGMADRQADLTRWADAYERLLGSLSTLPHIKDQEVIPVLREAMDVFTALAAQRLEAPGDDLISSMVTGLCAGAGADVEQACLTTAANCVVLVAGGYQTLTHLITSGLLLLDRYPGQRDLLMADPGLIGSTVDEILRIDGSSQYVARQVTRDVELAGRELAAGQTVLVHLAAANLDPRKFSEPRSFTIGRREGKHLGFGMGRHYCVGAPYAERLAAWAILGFLERYPDYRAQPDGVTWGHHVNTRCRASAIVEIPAKATVHNHAVVEWNDTDVPLGTHTLWHEVFQERARLSPDSVAAEDAQGSYTYQELDQRANAAAHSLRAQGVQPESVVAVLMDGSLDCVVAVLAVAKAGGAFLLADAACPAERLRVMVEEARVCLVIGSTSAARRLPDVPVSVLHDAGMASIGPLTGAGGDNTAYVVFTSGTTGRPKAIAISHRGVVNLHVAQRRVFRLTPADRVLQFLSPNFDGCVFEIVLALLCGSVLVLAPAVQLTVGPPLLRTLTSRRVTVVTMTPSVWSALTPMPLPDLRIAAAAGERLPTAVVDRWGPDRRFLNLYGPAEAAVWTTWAECSPGGVPDIGRPVANKKVYVLDATGAPAAIGEEGELHIGGIGLGRYLWRPELMESRFRRDPIGGTGLLYRTGDWCRWLPGGTLEFLGRRDRQTKIRGQRVELDEVERVIEAAHDVVAAAVIERDGALHATIVPASPTSETALRDYLSARLHSGMLPATFTFVAELPRTANGKTAVPEPPPLAPEAVTVIRGRTPDTSAVAESNLVWQLARQYARCLRLPQHQVKHDSDFFSLGGDSLAMAQLLTWIERKTGAVMDVQTLLDRPSPRDIALHALNTTEQRAGVS